MPPRIAPRVADVADQRAGVDAADARHAAVAEPVEPASLGGGDVLAVLGVAHDDAAGVDAVGLHRRGGDPVVADQRVGEDDDLAGVGGVGDRLLVAGHRGVEDDLAGDRLDWPQALAVEAGPVLEQDVGAHAATPRRSCAGGRRPGRRRRSSAPARSGSGRRTRSSASGSRSRPRRPSTRRRGRRGRRWPRCPAPGSGARSRTARRRRPSARPAGRARSTPGRTSSVCRAAKAVSSPVTPIAACSKGTSFSSAACGAWSVAMHSIVPSRRPSISAWRSPRRAAAGSS